MFRLSNEIVTNYNNRYNDEKGAGDAQGVSNIL